MTTVTISELAALIRQLEADTDRDDAHQLALDSLREAAPMCPSAINMRHLVRPIC
jgi:hypothetical protein